MIIKNNNKIMKSIFTLVILSCLTLVSSAQCVKGNCHRGHGTFEWENGSFFEGSWVDGLPNGYGDFYYENGDRFKGQFSKGQKSGNGRYTWKNGNYYDGNWNKDKMTGRGKFHWAKDGGSYEGLFKDGQIVNIEIAVTVDTPEKDAK